MPSNKELITTAGELAEQLGEKLGAPVDIETDGKNNADLVALVSDLRAKLADAETPSDADEAEAAAKAKAEAEAAAKAEAEAEAAAKAKAEAEAAAKAEARKGKKPPFYVAPGKSLTSQRGILSGDRADEVKASDLAGGEDALQAFIDSGHVLKGG